MTYLDKKTAITNLAIDVKQRANPKQRLFFEAKTRYIGYGGALGGGKSWAVQRKASGLCVQYPGITCLIIRKTYPELTQNHIQPLQLLLDGIATYKDVDKTFYFYNGSKIICGYLDNDKSLTRYQGNEYDCVFIDEATNHTYYQVNILGSRVRGANDFPKRMYFTCNPGGVGHQWVKRLFIDKRYNETEDPNDYTFIPATVYDNKVLMERDPEYIKTLDNLDPKVRAAYRDGNWDALAGQYFSEFDRNVHVVEPFTIPDHWKRYCGMDYGLDCLAIVWLAIDERGNAYVYREFAEEGVKIAEASQRYLQHSYDEHILATYAPPDMWGRSQESGKEKVNIFYDNGWTNLVKSNNNREAGWLAVADLLKVIDVGEGIKECRLHIFSNCLRLIEYLPALQIDEKKPTDCATEPHEITHLPDALRYALVQWYTATKVKPVQSELCEIKQRILRGSNNRRVIRC